MRVVVVLSGAVANVESTGAGAILSQVNGTKLSTRAMVVRRKNVASERVTLQRARNELDEETAFGWVADDVERKAMESDRDLIVVDAVCRIEQIDRLRAAFPEWVRRVQLSIDPDELASRHAARKNDVEEPAGYMAKFLAATMETMIPELQHLMIRQRPAC